MSKGNEIRKHKESKKLLRFYKERNVKIHKSVCGCCGMSFYNIDGCPNCGTDMYIIKEMA